MKSQRMQLVAVLGLLVLSASAAGCFTTGEPLPTSPTVPATTDAFEAVRELMAPVPCTVESLGPRTSDNLLPLATIAVEQGGRANLDPWNSWIVTGHGTGLDFIDGRDPLNVTIAETYLTDRGYGDAKWLANGTAVVVARPDNTIEIIGVTWIDGMPNGTSLGIWHYPLPGPGHLFTNMHMLEAHTIAGEHYFFVAPNDDTGVWIVRVGLSETKATFEALPPIGPPFTGGPLGPHDMTVEHDLLLQKPILYIANGFEGWLAYDISNPAAPQRLAVVPNMDQGQSYLHTVAGNVVGGRRIVATIAEVGNNVMRLYDATNFATPILLAQWWSETTSPQQPQHDINILTDKLYVAHYSEGAYVFDLTELNTLPLVGTASIAPVAHFVPPNPMDGGALGFANVFDVVVVDGILYIADFTDSENAVTAVGYGCLTPGDRLLTSG